MPAAAGIHGHRNLVRGAIAALLCLLTLPAAARDPSAAIRAVTASDDYQLELPIRVTASPSAARPWIEEGAPGIKPYRDQGIEELVEPGTPNDGMLAFRLLLWTVLGVGVVLLLMRLVAMVGRGRTPLSAAGPEETVEAPGEPFDPTLQAADRLARQADYGAAMHVLMLSAIEEVRARVGAMLTPALTSREVVDRVRAGNGRWSDLSWIVGAVELTLFGGRSPSEALYRQCRDRYLSFVGVESGVVDVR